MRKRPPRDLPGQIEFVGACLYGAWWRRRLALALGISRTTLHAWMKGLSKSDRDVAGELLFLVDKERGAAGVRSAQLTVLRNDLIAVTGRQDDVT
jgi:hypothetical protein